MGITLRRCHALSADKQTSASWHQDAGTKTAQFTTKRQSGKTYIFSSSRLIQTLEVVEEFPIVFTMSILVLFDVMVMIKKLLYAYYFIFSVYCFLAKR